MTKAEIEKAVQAWFCMDNYSVLHDLTVEQLFTQMDNRIVAWRMMTLWDEIASENRTVLSDYLDEVMTGRVVFGDVFGRPERTLLSSYAVKPLTREDLREVGTFMTVAEVHASLRESPACSPEVSQYLKEAGLNSKGAMLLEINFSAASSDEIIEHLKVMLPSWKKQLAPPEPPVRDFRFGVSTIRKILDYHLIPMMDLLLWGTYEQIRIGIPQLTGFLWPDEFLAGVRGVENVKATDYPLAVSFLKDPTLFRSFIDFMYKYDDKKHWKVRDLIDTELD
ncbi:DUF6387 family protein [Pantoea sp. MT58]|uniref:DUF6387 family protein n=1 Tax=Pantoea sp. MT58 TaxID=2768165 RepID=UPI00165BC410|nr:DUF6387 family protein [Pantoea sp. MT58]QNQ60070.1 hypothetical protein IAI47_07465 [Pantoea sp. MT58]